MSNGRITNAEIRSEQELINLGADRTYLPHSSKIYIEKTGIEQRLDEYLVKNHFVATRDPDEFDDSTQNFEVGSQWVNTLTEKIFTLVVDAASGAVWTQGGGGIETFVTIVEAEAREDSEEYDLIYVVENETIYRYSASGLSSEPDDGFYILSDDNNVDGRWRGLAGRYVFEGIGGIETFVTVAEAELRENNDDYELIYVVETETIYRYSATGMSGIPDDGFYILKDALVSDGRWKAIAGKYILDREDSGTYRYSHTITAAETGVWSVYQSERPFVEAYFWDDSENQYNLLSAASLSLDISVTGAISYDTTSFVFNSNDKIILYASYTTTTIQNANEFDSGWIEISSINDLPSSGFHRIDLPSGFDDNPAGYSLTLDDGLDIFPSDIASRLIFSNDGLGTYRVTVDTEGLDSTDKFRLICSKSARPTGSLSRGIIHDAVVGTTEQVNSGFASYTSLQTAIDFLSSGGRILVLTSVTENITWNNSNITVEGKGRSTEIIGTINIVGDGNSLKLVRCLDSVTLNGDINFFSESWLAPTYTVTDNGTGNYYNVIEEV